MEKYIILIVMLFLLLLYLLLLYLNKNIEGNTGYNEIGDTYGWRSGVIEGRKQFSVEDISRSQLIFKKCNEAQTGYTPPLWKEGDRKGCLKKCEHKMPITNGPQRLDGNCGQTLYDSGTLKNYKLCPKKCTSTFKEQEEEWSRRSQKKPTENCINDNECSTCYKDISYNSIGGDDKKFKCGMKTSCPMALTVGYDADGSGVIFPMDGCGGYTDTGGTNGAGADGATGGAGADGADGAGGGTGATGGAAGGGTGGGTGAAGGTGAGGGTGGTGAAGAESDARIARIAAAAAIILKDDPFTSSNETVDCSTYPKHPKCGHTHKPQMFGCINNAKEGEINSMSKPGTLDSSWGLFK